MEKVSFEEVEGFDVPGALNGEKVEIPSGSGVNNSESVTEHVYVVFSENISIENGIKLIEDSVLGGEKLDVTRQDETGHAIVCIVNSAQREAIEKLSEVERVKVETAARPTDGKAEESVSVDGAKTGQDAGQSKKNDESWENSAQNIDTSNEKNASGETATTKESSEAPSEEISSETASTVYDNTLGQGNNQSPFIGVAIVAAIAILAIGIAAIFRKRK